MRILIAWHVHAALAVLVARRRLSLVVGSQPARLPSLRRSFFQQVVVEIEFALLHNFVTRIPESCEILPLSQIMEGIVRWEFQNKCDFLYKKWHTIKQWFHFLPSTGGWDGVWSFFFTHHVAWIKIQNCSTRTVSLWTTKYVVRHNKFGWFMSTGYERQLQSLKHYFPSKIWKCDMRIRLARYLIGLEAATYRIRGCI
jgi:hypothetical protein